MADENNELLTQFVSITGADAETSKVYLQSAGWDLQSAMENYLDNAPSEGMENDELSVIPPQPVVPPSNTPTSRSRKPRFATLDSFAPEQEEGDDDDRQAFYAGGSETSGQQIVGPPRKKKEKTADLTQNIFDSAKRHGAEVVDRSQDESKKKKAPAFRGSGFRLGDTEGLSDVIQSPSTSNMEPPEPVNVELNFWSNGFSIDDGPLRDMNDPENEEFLRTITNGEIPQELLRLYRGRQINVNMVKKDTEYVKPKETVKAFSGAGHTLGSPTPKLVSSRSATSSSTASSTQAPKVDDSEPVTSLQIRLADGTRLVAKFNHTSTVNDIRNFINASRPQMAGRDYVLMTTFPRKEFTDETLTLTDAKLLNAVIVQQYKQR